MKVVLNQDVKGVGKAGEVKDVADGYARNFLLRRKLAAVATEGAVKTAEARQAAVDRRAEHEESLARAEATRISAEPIVLRAKMGDQGRLYGSITAADIAEELARKWGHEFDKRKIELDEPLRNLGSYTVPIQIHRNVTAQVTVDIQPTQD
ncbi:MAG: 50S ribosomal protein L9 [Chloroflexota bacterium]